MLRFASIFFVVLGVVVVNAAPSLDTESPILIHYSNSLDQIVLDMAAIRLDVASMEATFSGIGTDILVTVDLDNLENGLLTVQELICWMIGGLAVLIIAFALGKCFG